MAWVWTTMGVIGLAAAALTSAAAVAVYAAAPQRGNHRLLAAFLLTGAASFAAGLGLMYSTDAPQDAYAWQIVAIMAGIAQTVLYVAFLTTLIPRWSRALAPARVALCAAAVVLPLAPLARPAAFVAGVVPGTFSPWDAATGPLWPILLWTYFGVSVSALVLAVSLYRAAPRGSLRRGQAAAYLAAFLVYDATMGILSGYFAVTGAVTEWGMHTQIIGGVAFVLLLAYGVLKTQLFDIDLKVKGGLSRGTVAAAIAAAFFLASEGVERLLPVDGTFAGLAAAGALAITFRPLERWASRLADRAMPTVRDTPEYVDARKLDVYRAAYAEMVAGGEFTERDRKVLAAIRARLDIAEDAAGDVEREAARAASEAA